MRETYKNSEIGSMTETQITTINELTIDDDRSTIETFLVTNWKLLLTFFKKFFVYFYQNLYETWNSNLGVPDYCHGKYEKKNVFFCIS